MNNKLLYIWKAIIGLLFITTLIGCATIIGKSSPETLNLRSNPEQASIVITDEKGAKIFEGKTPTTIALEKKRGYFTGKKYNVKIAKEGYYEQNVTVDTKLNGWYLGGNFVFGGLIGWLIIDPATGAMWTLDTNELNVTLESSKQSKQVESFQIGVALLNDIPVSLRHKMVKFSP